MDDSVLVLSLLSLFLSNSQMYKPFSKFSLNFRTIVLLLVKKIKTRLHSALNPLPQRLSLQIYIPFPNVILLGVKHSHLDNLFLIFINGLDVNFPPFLSLSFSLSLLLSLSVSLSPFISFSSLSLSLIHSHGRRK